MAKDADALLLELKILQEQYELRTKEKIDGMKEAVKIALDANEKRLDTMNEFRKALSDQAAQMMTRVEGQLIINQHHEQLIGQIKPLQDKVDVMSRPNYILWAGFGSLIAAAITGCWIVIGLRMDEVTIPINNQLSGITVLANERTDSLKRWIALLWEKQNPGQRFPP